VISTLPFASTGSGAGGAGGGASGSRSGTTSSAMRGMNRSVGKAMFSDWCGRSVLYSCRNASIAACAISRSGQTLTWSSSSCWKVWWNRSTFPVVVGDRGLVWRATMPFSWQIRSNITSAGRGRVNRPVNCFPLSVSTSSGSPYACNASANAAHTARPVARRTTVAITQNREWSSTPVTIFVSEPSASRMPSTMSSCHNSIGTARSHRR
jgi:hypothetical protein